jgi:hypothetical protein
MHRFRSWTLDPPEYRTQRNRLLPIEGGDGSTLNLDFTTGVLDPRLTLTRGTNATFINSSGLVEWAAANNFTNSTFSGSSGTTVPNWSFSVPTGAATVSLSGTELTITCTTATRARVVQNIGTATGLFVTTQVKVTARSMAFPLNEVLAYSVNGSSQEQYKVNGVDRSPSYTGWSVGDVISLTCIPANGLAAQAVIGIGASAAQPAGQSITITNVQAEPGIVARTVIPTGTSGSYQSPRFDHDPTTGSPRGLLIEGLSVNLINNSNNIYTGSWGGSVGITATQDTTIPDPSGGTTTCKIVKAASYQYVVRNQPIPTLTVPANSTVHLTISVWLRMDGANQVAASLGIYDSAGASFGTRSGASVSNSAVTISSGSSADAEFTFGAVTGWVRCSISRSFTNATGSSITFPSLGFYIYPNRLNTNATTIYAWGAQAETGIGPSSLIPTATSQGTRNPDYCVMDGISSFFTSQSSLTMLIDATPRFQSGFPALWRLTDTGNVNSYELYYTSSGTNNTYATKVTAGGVGSGESNFANSIPQDTRQIMGYAIASGVGFRSRNGVSASAQIPTSLPSAALMRLGIGSSGLSGNPSTAHIRRIKYWPYAMTQDQLNGVTTP